MDYCNICFVLYSKYSVFWFFWTGYSVLNWTFAILCIIMLFLIVEHLLIMWVFTHVIVHTCYGIYILFVFNICCMVLCYDVSFNDMCLKQIFKPTEFLIPKRCQATCWVINDLNYFLKTTYTNLAVYMNNLFRLKVKAYKKNINIARKAIAVFPSWHRTSSTGKWHWRLPRWLAKMARRRINRNQGISTCWVRKISRFSVLRENCQGGSQRWQEEE